MCTHAVCKLNCFYISCIHGMAKPKVNAPIRWGWTMTASSFCIDISAVSFSLQEKMWHSTLGG